MKIENRRNYSEKWVLGADSVRISNIRDHSYSEQHIHAIMLHRKSQAQSIGLGASAYAPIARALEDDKKSLRIKFIFVPHRNWLLPTTLFFVSWRPNMG